MVGFDGILRRRRRAMAGATALAVLLAAFVLYRSTMLPGMDLGDTPSFQTMGASRYITPRDAYPLYFALAAPLVWWVGTDPAPAMNLMSVLAASTACGVFFLLALELSGAIAAALVAAIALAGSYTFWSQAVITEVYALHLLCITVVLLALLKWERQPTESRLTIFFALYALSFGNHLSMVVLLPAFVLFLLMAAPGGIRDLLTPRVVATAVLCAIAGALQYGWNVRTMLISPVRPSTLLNAAHSFWFDVTKADWRETMLGQVPTVMIGDRLRMFVFDVHQQFGWPMVALAAAGVQRMARRGPERLWLLSACFVSTATFALTYNVGDTHVFLLPTHLIIACFIAPGVAWLSDLAAQRAGWLARPAVFAAILTILAVRIHEDYPALDRSADRRPEAVLSRLTADLDDHRAILLADLNWQVQNGLNYYARHLRRNLAFALMDDVLPYAPTLLRDNLAIGREVLVTQRARDRLVAMYGSQIRADRDPRIEALSLRERTATVAGGTRYVLCVVKPTSDLPLDRSDMDAALRQLTGGAITGLPAGDYVVIAGLAGRPPALFAHDARPFRTTTTLDGLQVQVRMEAWLPFDTIRRMGFGHVIAGRHHALIVERGASLVTLDDRGAPTRVEYAAGLFAPQPRYALQSNVTD